MNDTELVLLDCPYCGEPIQLIVDCSVPDQDYIEDCQVCCRPILIHSVIDIDGFPDVTVRSEDE